VIAVAAGTKPAGAGCLSDRLWCAAHGSTLQEQAYSLAGVHLFGVGGSGTITNEKRNEVE
jgi:hypothetical protein